MAWFVVLGGGRMTSPVAEAVAELIPALDDAHHSIYHPDTETPAMITGGHPVTGSSPPWNTPAADAYFTATATIRQLEVELLLAANLPIRPRGGTHTNTLTSLQMITRLDSSDATAARIHHAQTPCDRLPARDTQERPIPIRLTPGAPKPPLCPYCRTAQLRLLQRAGRVLCFYPDCQDGNGQRPAASLTRNYLDGTPQLIGDDGTIW